MMALKRKKNERKKSVSESRSPFFHKDAQSKADLCSRNH